MSGHSIVVATCVAGSLVACGGNNNHAADAPQQDAAQALDAAPDAPIQTASIFGTATFTAISDTGSDVGEYLPQFVTITSFSLAGSSFVEETGAYAHAAFDVPVVAGDTTYDIGLQLTNGLPVYIVGGSTTPAFDTFQFGRFGTFATQPTPVDVTLTGLLPWGAADNIEIMSTNSGSVFYQPYLQFATAPAVGDTAITDQTFDWHASSRQRPLIDASAGDHTIVYQLSTAGSGADTYAAIAAVGSDDTFTLHDGSAATLDVALAAVTQDQTLAVHWQRSQFEALRTQVGSGAVDFQNGLFISALPFAAEHGFYNNAPDILEFFPPISGSDTDETWSYADPFTTVGGAKLDEFCISNYRFVVPVTAPHATRPEGLIVGYLSDRPVPQLQVDGTIAPDISAAQDVMIEGQPLVDGVSGVGLTPTVSWSAPSLGTATGYAIEVWQAENKGGTTSLSELAAFLTTQTSLRIPPGVVQLGQGIGNFVTITAIGDPAFHADRAPFLLSLPMSEMTLASGVFQP